MDEFINTLRVIYTPSKFLFNIAHILVKKKINNNKRVGGHDYTPTHTHPSKFLLDIAHSHINKKKINSLETLILISHPFWNHQLIDFLAQSLGNIKVSFSEEDLNARTYLLCIFFYLYAISPTFFLHQSVT